MKRFTFLLIYLLSPAVFSASAVLFPVVKADDFKNQVANLATQNQKNLTTNLKDKVKSMGTEFPPPVADATHKSETTTTTTLTTTNNGSVIPTSSEPLTVMAPNTNKTNTATPTPNTNSNYTGFGTGTTTSTPSSGGGASSGGFNIKY